VGEGIDVGDGVGDGIDVGEGGGVGDEVGVVDGVGGVAAGAGSAEKLTAPRKSMRRAVGMTKTRTTVDVFIRASR